MGTYRLKPCRPSHKGSTRTKTSNSYFIVSLAMQVGYASNPLFYLIFETDFFVDEQMPFAL
jgi:hypothetical protein